MTAAQFRLLALSLPGTEEAEHCGHPDFRAHGRVFASLGYPDSGHGMVRLRPEQQEAFIERAPHLFSPCKGAWGRNGATAVLLSAATRASLLPALAAAHENAGLPAKKRRRAT